MADENEDLNSTESILDTFSLEFENENSSGEPRDGGEKETSQETPPETPEENPEEKADKPEEKSDENTSGSVDEGKGLENGGVAKINAPSEPAAPTSDALLAEALKAISALTAKKEPSPEEKAPAKPEEDADAKVFSPKKFEEYSFNISPKLYNGLFGSDATEEERLTCLQAYASGIATTVHNKILAELGEWTKKQFSLVPSAVDYIISARESRVASQKSLRDDFYGSYPELNKPELLPLIKATIEAVQKETGARNWDGKFKTLVGSRVKSILSAYSQAGRPIPVAPKTVAPAASPAVNKTSVGDPNSPEAILDVFNSEF